MKHYKGNRSWVAVLSIGYLVACSGKLNVHGTQNGATAGSGGGAASGAGGGGSTSGAAAGTSAGGSLASGMGGGGLRAVDMSTCPVVPPADASGCATEGLGCGSFSAADQQYSECWCVEYGASDLRWYCDHLGLSALSCPPTMPAHGTDCFGHYGTSCAYPIGNQCDCTSPSGSWSCYGRQRPDFPAPPATVPPSTAINAMTDPQRASWCRWALDAQLGRGTPDPEEVPVGADGFTQGGMCRFGFQPTCRVALASLSVRQCSQNLTTSTCAAPIADLTDCVTTLLASGVPSPHGCARFMAEPGCEGTMVVDWAPMATGGTLGTAGTGTAVTAGTGGTAGSSDTGGTGGSADALPVPDYSCSVEVQ